MTDGPNFPGPGTAALFGAALVFAAVGFGEANSGIKAVALIGGLLLFLVGSWIEWNSFKERKETREKKQ